MDIKCVISLVKFYFDVRWKFIISGEIEWFIYVVIWEFYISVRESFIPLRKVQRRERLIRNEMCRVKKLKIQI